METTPKPEDYWLLKYAIHSNPVLLAVVLLGVMFVCAAIFFGLTLVPNRARKPLVMAITFLAGLFFALEFFWPVVAEPVKGVTPALQPGENFLTPWVKPISDISQVLQAFAIGLGIFSVASLHLRAIARRRATTPFSIVLLTAMVAMFLAGVMKEYYPGSKWETAHKLLYTGGLSNLNSAMFSIVAFYIVSAAYRAFRIRSVEATILLVTAALVMIGQVTFGQALTNGLPTTGFANNFHTDVIADYILKRINSPAILAVNLGLGIGLLATSLRIWLSLERGSYFEKEL